ncbi:MAG: hypothetical protein JXB85_04070 [Anaerolineales bacterium]|nr:hypothetical protein [Anaerolineales bacterium]
MEAPSTGEPAVEAPSAPTVAAVQPTPPTQLPAILETRRLTLEWPPFVRAGDADVIRLTLEVDAGGHLTPTAEYETHTITGQAVEIPNLYDTHTVLAIARLDMAGLEVAPPGQVSEALRPGRSVTFYWSIRPAEVGQYRGTVWFLLRFIPLDGGPESERALAALPIEVEAISFYGLKAGPARWLGAIGAFFGGVLGMPFLEDIARWLFDRLRRRAR